MKIKEAVFPNETLEACTSDWIAQASRVCRRASEGDLEARIVGINVEGELGEMLHAINTLLDTTDAFVRESQAALAFAGRGDFFREVLPNGMNGSFGRAARGINEVTDALERQAKLVAVAQSTRVSLAEEFETVVNKIVDSVVDSSEQVHEISGQLSQLAEKSSKNATAVAGALEQTTTNVEAVAKAAETLVASSTALASDAMESGGDQFARAMRDVVTESESTNSLVGGLAEESAKISGVVKLITDIAAQTKLLALNATIEAASAGEAGRGFSVVASEVKNLAQQTAEATDNIENQVSSIKTSTQRAGKAIKSIGQTITKCYELSDAIIEAAASQRSTTHEISTNIAEAAVRNRGVTEETHALAEATLETSSVAVQLVESSESLGSQARNLRIEAKRFLEEIRRE